MWWVVVQLLLLTFVLGGHEVLYKHVPTPQDVKPDELLIFQYDSRPLQDYWNASVRWNKAFADKYGHRYVFLSSKGNCRFGPHLLADAWCKVKAMILADKLAQKDNSIKACLYLDSDAVITVNNSMTTVISYIRKDLGWDVSAKPVALNQDGPGWSCKYTLKLGYEQCLNSGTVLWVRSSTSSDILLDWWTSAGEPYKTVNKFPSKWRTKVQQKLCGPLQLRRRHY
jgi:hypothetical protein